MKLLASGFSTAETTFASRQASTGYGAGKSMTVRRVVAMCGGTTVAANSSGGVNVVFGMSSDAPESTLTFPTPKSADATSGGSAAAAQWELEGLSIQCGWLEARTNEAAHGGWSVFVFGD